LLAKLAIAHSYIGDLNGSWRYRIINMF